MGYGLKNAFGRSCPASSCGKNEVFSGLVLPTANLISEMQAKVGLMGEMVEMTRALLDEFKRGVRSYNRFVEADAHVKGVIDLLTAQIDGIITYIKLYATDAELKVTNNLFLQLIEHLKEHLRLYEAANAQLDVMVQRRTACR